MTYIIPYEADFICAKGHSFVAPVGALVHQSSVCCPACYREWVAENVFQAEQSSAPRRVENRTTATMDVMEAKP